MCLEICWLGGGIKLWPLLPAAFQQRLPRNVCFGVLVRLMNAALEVVLDIALGPNARRWRWLGGCEAGHVRVALVGRGRVG